MDNALNKLRKKFIIMATAISFGVISLMIIILNLLMQLNYNYENQIIIDIISQTALVNTPLIDTERFYFKDLEPTSNGDYILSSVNINNVDHVTLYGSISSIDENTSWYCGGGGLMFYFQQSTGENILVHKEYVFNANNTSVTIDFSNYNDIMYNAEYITLENGKILGNGLIVSSVWWCSSSKNIQDNNISINLDSIEIVYKSNIDINNTSNYSIKHKDFTSIFGDDIPTLLNGMSSFYIVTDTDFNLLEVNYGNLINKIPDSEILSYIDTIKYNKNADTILVNNGIQYNYTINSNNNIQVIMFVYNVTENIILQKLLIISILVGLVLIIILFITILIVSKNVTKPIKIALEKQKEFISNASHELKTPITVISTTIDLLKNQIGENRWITCIKEQSEKMGYLVKELLTLARLSEFQSSTKMLKSFDISQTTSNAILYFECRAYEENKVINLNIQEGITFLGDENKITELVNILIDNALKYSKSNTPVNFSLKTIKNKIIIECSNSYEDTTNLDVTRIFERFYRNDKAHSNEKEGFGLGLSIAQSIVEYHNGNIKAKKINDTINFIIILPNVK